MNIVVLAGGLSPERDVSLSSGTMACNALLSLGHRAILVDLFFGLPDWDGKTDLFSEAKQLPLHVGQSAKECANLHSDCLIVIRYTKTGAFCDMK